MGKLHIVLIKTSSLKHRLEELTHPSACTALQVSRRRRNPAGISSLHSEVPCLTTAHSERDTSQHVTSSSLPHGHRGGQGWEKAQKSMCTWQQPWEQVEEAQIVQEAEITVFCWCQWTFLSSLGRTQNAAASQLHRLHPSQLSSLTQPDPCTRVWQNTKGYTKKNTTIPEQWIPGTLQEGVWGPGSRTNLIQGPVIKVKQAHISSLYMWFMSWHIILHGTLTPSQMNTEQINPWRIPVNCTNTGIRH